MQTELISREALRIWLDEKNYNHFFFCPRWKISRFFLEGDEKSKVSRLGWNVVQEYVDICVFCFIFKCVCIYIYIEFLSSFVFLWCWIFGQRQFEPRACSVRLWYPRGVPELTIIDLWLFLPLTWPFDLCVAMLRSLCGSQFHKNSTGETELCARDSALRAKNSRSACELTDCKILNKYSNFSVQYFQEVSLSLPTLVNNVKMQWWFQFSSLLLQFAKK